MRKFEGDLFQELWDGTYTQVERPRFEILKKIAEEISIEKIEGDIVECGIWRGGVVIYMSYLFPEKTIWGLDSFDGFQNIEDAVFKYDGHERHTHDFDAHNPMSVRGGYSIKIDEEHVKQNIRTFGLEPDKDIKLIKGFVRDTTNPQNCPIEKIALLRIDVDAYSATLETLTNLYDKVVPGGYIVFDDIPLYECQDAIKEFKKMREIEFELIGDSQQSGYYGGCYLKKQI